jgi:hypothetical protein
LDFLADMSRRARSTSALATDLRRARNVRIASDSDQIAASH